MYFRIFFVPLHSYLEDILTIRTPPDFDCSLLYTVEHYVGKIKAKLIENVVFCLQIVPTYQLFNTK